MFVSYVDLISFVKMQKHKAERWRDIGKHERATRDTEQGDCRYSRDDKDTVWSHRVPIRENHRQPAVKHQNTYSKTHWWDTKRALVDLTCIGIAFNYWVLWWLKACPRHPAVHRTSYCATIQDSDAAGFRLLHEEQCFTVAVIHWSHVTCCIKCKACLMYDLTSSSYGSINLNL